MCAAHTGICCCVHVHVQMAADGCAHCGVCCPECCLWHAMLLWDAIVLNSIVCMVSLEKSEVTNAAFSYRN